MSYVALYRKFRPQTFDQVKGQDHVVRTLKNQLLYHRIGHAYLFTGTRGTGKTSAAKIFAKAVNCLHPVNGEPCNECENCKAVNAGNFVDVVEVDAASNNGVDDIRRIIEEVRYTPVSGTYKVFIIDEAHMITGPAFNAFLKTLEEPPGYAIFILATTEPHKLPVTILSRCQRYDFRRISAGQIAQNLAEIAVQEGVEADPKALEYIAHAGDGSMRDAVSLLDKCIAFNLGEKLTYANVLNTLGTMDTEVFSRLFRYVYAGDAASALSVIDRAVSEGRDLAQFATDLIWYIRSILLVRSAMVKDPEVLGISAENMEQLVKDAQIADDAVLMRYIRILSELVNQIRMSADKQILLEVGIIKLAKPQMETDTESLADRIRQLEANITHNSRPFPMQMTDPDIRTDFMEDSEWMGSDDYYQADIPEPTEQAMKDEMPAEPPRKADTMQETMPAAQQNIWDEVVHLCDNPRIRFILNKCSAETSGDNTVRIYAPNEFVVKQLKEEDVMAYVQQLSGQAAGRPVQIQVQQGMITPGKDLQQPAFPEELLNNINFNIGTEEW